MKNSFFIAALFVCASLVSCKNGTSNKGEGNYADSAYYSDYADSVYYSDYDTISSGYHFNTSALEDDDDYGSSGVYSTTVTTNNTSNSYGSSYDDEYVDLSRLCSYIKDAQTYLRRASNEYDTDEIEYYARKAESSLSDAASEADDLSDEASGSLSSDLWNCKRCLSEAESYARLAKNAYEYEEMQDYIRRANNSLNDAIRHLQ